MSVREGHVSILDTGHRQKLPTRRANNGKALMIGKKIRKEVRGTFFLDLLYVSPRHSLKGKIKRSRKAGFESGK